MKSLLIVNPIAGQGRPEEALAAVRAVFRPLVAEIVVTRARGDALAAAHRAALGDGGFDALLVAGGDGTLNEAINGLLRDLPPGAPAPLPLGLVPLGTQNVLAHDLGIPRGPLEDVAAMFQAGQTRRIDLGLAGSHYFSLMAGFGFDAAVVGEVVHPVKDLIGPAAYAFAALGALAKYHSTRVRLVLDEEEIVSEAFLVVVANATSYALRQFKLAPFAALDDGWLDICVFERAPMHKVGFLTQLMAVAARRHLRDPRVRYYRARRIEIDSAPPILGQLDGDMSDSTPLRIEVIPQALSVFVP